ncbi:MAG: rod shape-determining protein MreC [Candidatus Dojkabacteria bacterium]|jgi:cell shape-determining protein MreC
MKSKNSIFDKTYISFIFVFFVTLMLVLLDSIGVVNPLRKTISFVFEPVSYNGSEIGGRVREYFASLTKMDEFRKDYNKLKVDIYEKDVNNSYYLLLKEENEALKKQLQLADITKKYVEAKVLSGGNSEYLRINVGSKDGVEQDDVVSIGNMYIGQVIKADLNGSLVKLAASKDSRFEVILTESGVKDAVISSSPTVLTKAVVVGLGNSISVENINVNANVKDGDIVVLNDEKIGAYLVLGYLVGLSDNPASTSRTGYVTPLADYDSLITVFVNIN